MKWRRNKSSSSTKHEWNGLFTEIPHRGYTGWICGRESPLDGETTSCTDCCVSRFVSFTDFILDDAIDLVYPPRESDEPEKYGYSYDNANWSCFYESIEEDVLPADGFDHTD